MKRSMIITLAVATVAVAGIGISIANKVAPHAIVPSIFVANNATATIALSGNSNVSANGTATAGFPASLQPGAPQQFTLSAPTKAMQITYTANSSDPGCSYVLIPQKNQTQIVTSSNGMSNTVCDASAGQNNSVAFIVTSNSA